MRLALVIVVIVVSTLSSTTAAQQCNYLSNCNEIVQNFDMKPTCPTFNPGGGATSDLRGTGASADAAENAWRQWYYLDISNDYIWLNESTCVNQTISSNTVEVAWAATNAFSFGRTSYQCKVLSNNIKSFDIEVNTNATANHSRCAESVFTENATWVHELGHAYGYDHFDDYLSTLNTAQPDVFSCRVDRQVRPSSQAQHCHDDNYGLAGGGHDIGSSALRKSCALTTAGCATLPGETRFFDPSDTYEIVAAQFTFMNMRTSFPTLTVVPVDYHMTADNFYQGTDPRFASNTFTTQTAPSAVFKAFLFGINPQSVIPLGTTRCVILRLDPNNTIFEWESTDNTMDTRFCYVR